MGDTGFVDPPSAQLLALQLSLEVSFPWWGDFIRDPRIDDPPTTADTKSAEVSCETAHVHSCTDIARPSRSVSFNFAIEFWFPEPDQIELPLCRKPPARRPQPFPGPSILCPTEVKSSLEGCIPSTPTSTLSTSSAPFRSRGTCPGLLNHKKALDALTVHGMCLRILSFFVKVNPPTKLPIYLWSLVGVKDQVKAPPYRLQWAQATHGPNPPAGN